MTQQSGNGSTNGSEQRQGPRGLGTLESQLMRVLWGTADRLTVQQVVDNLGEDHNYKTVMTVLNRLVEKELLDRELDGRAYRYFPRLTREQFLRSVADELVKGYLASFGEGAGPHIVEAVYTAVPQTAKAPDPEPDSSPEQPPVTVVSPAYHNHTAGDLVMARPVANAIGIATVLLLVTFLLRKLTR